nr:hypothetical protein [Tanacetum cinerariifolium]
MAMNETTVKRYKALAMVTLEQESYASALSCVKKARRNWNELLMVFLIWKSDPGEEQGRQDSLCSPRANIATNRLLDPYKTLDDADAKQRYDQTLPTCSCWFPCFTN